MRRYLAYSFIILFYLQAVQADDDLEQMIKNMQTQAISGTTKESSQDSVPHYSKQTKNQETARLNAINEDDLRKEGHKTQLASEKDENNVMGITSKASKKDVLPGFEDLQMFKRADEIFNDPISIFNTLTEKDCKEHLAKQNHSIGKRDIVEEKQDTIYEKQQCEQPNSIFKCEKELHLTCKESKECNYGGIVKDSVATDMKFDFYNNILTIGTIADNYWQGYCQVYGRPTSFELKNINQIREFKIIELGFDDYLLVKINGNTVYVGPNGGDKLEVQERKDHRFNHNYNVVYNGLEDLACERNTNWRFSVNIDLKPYLKEGKNEIFMKTIVSGAGEGWIKIKASQHCCSSWEEEWRQRCSAN